MLEYEKKVLLTKEEYSELIRALGNRARMKSQTNYYFDTEDLKLNSKGITCRIRLKNGEYEATIKHHKTGKDDCSLEENLGITDSFFPNIFLAAGLLYHGELITQRIVIHKNHFCEIVLDYNCYLGITDYELEIEYNDGYEKNALSALQQVASHFVNRRLIENESAFLLRVDKGDSKSERFFKRKKCDAK